MPSITWGTLKAEIGRMLDDPAHGTYSETLLLDGINAALIAFASTHTGIASDFTLTGDGSTYTFDLPSNIVDQEHAGVYAVEWIDQEWLREEKFWHGTQLPSTSRTTTSIPRAYALWPVGKISFFQVPGNSDTITLHYVAHYDDIVDNNSTIAIPFWAREAVKRFVVAYALAPGYMKTGRLRQYQAKREAGDPEDNPLLRAAEHHMKRYHEILAVHRVPQYKQDLWAEDYRR
jgi:hypothetical protein